MIYNLSLLYLLHFIIIYAANIIYVSHNHMIENS